MTGAGTGATRVVPVSLVGEPATARSAGVATKTTCARLASWKQEAAPVRDGLLTPGTNEPPRHQWQGGPASVMNVALSENHPWMPTDGAP